MKVFFFYAQLDGNLIACYLSVEVPYNFYCELEICTTFLTVCQALFSLRPTERTNN